MLLLCGGAAQAQVSWELRVGAAASTPLVVDSGGNGVVLDSIGRPLTPESTLALSIAPLLALSARTPLRAGSALELAASWSPARLIMESATGEEEVGDVALLTALLGVRFALGERAYVRPAAGVLAYLSDESGVFRQGSGGVRPSLEVAAGVRLPVRRVRVALELLAQAHTFTTQALREAGGRAGAVYRGGVQLAIGFGEVQP